MKLISFLNQGTPSYGIVNGDDVLDLTPILGAQAPDLKTLIARDLLGAAAEAAKTHPFSLKYNQLTLLPVIPNPGQIFCIGLNYGEHVRETGKEITVPFSENEMKQINDLAREAMGFQKERGDALSVANAQFNLPDKTGDEVPLWKDPENISYAKELLKFLVIGGIIIAIYLIVMKPIILTSNLTTERLAKTYAARIFDRIRQTSEVVRFSGESLRQARSA